MYAEFSKIESSMSGPSKALQHKLLLLNETTSAYHKQKIHHVMRSWRRARKYPYHETGIPPSCSLYRSILVKPFRWLGAWSALTCTTRAARHLIRERRRPWKCNRSFIADNCELVQSHHQRPNRIRLLTRVQIPQHRRRRSWNDFGRWCDRIGVSIVDGSRDVDRRVKGSFMRSYGL